MALDSDKLCNQPVTTGRMNDLQCNATHTAVDRQTDRQTPTADKTAHTEQTDTRTENKQVQLSTI